MKYSKPIMNAVNRFPPVYKRQALQMLDEATHNAVRTTVDTFVQAALVVLIEDFHFGTRKDATRLPRFVGALQRLVDATADEYDDSMAYALKLRLHNLGVEYHITKKGEDKE